MLGTEANISQINNKVIDQFVVLQNSLLNVLTFRGRIVWRELLRLRTLGKSPKLRKLIFHGFTEESKGVSEVILPSGGGPDGPWMRLGR